MNKYQLLKRCRDSKLVDKTPFIQNICMGKNVLDLGCLRHNSSFAEKDPTWLHQKIRDVAKMVIGIDYLKDEVRKINDLKYNYDIRYGDVTKPLSLEERFDVIVAGDLIEHLSNFDGFFDNISRLLKDDGILIISTPNPFYTDGFHYVAFKGAISINPEHTCWIDPLALMQLVSRFGFEIEDIYYLKHSWQLANLICENEKFGYNILTDQWSEYSIIKNMMRFGIGWLFQIIYAPYKILTLNDTKMVKHADYIAVIRKNGFANPETKKYSDYKQLIQKNWHKPQ